VEVHTLFLSGAASPLKDLGLAPAMEAALLKLLAALPQQRRDEAARARQRLHVDAAGWGQHGEAVPHLRALQEAVWQDRRVRMVYRHGRDEGVEPGERVVEPLGLVFKANIWYLVARSGGEPRTFRVSRVADVTTLHETFARPADFDLAAYWIASCAQFEASWQRYAATLRVAPELAPSIPCYFDEGAQTPLERAGGPDADGWLTFTVRFVSFEAARTRVLGFGPLVEVLAPAELRSSVVELAAGITRLYAGRSS
nr:WYL domain-containing protein [Ktedonobacterales bacterium]